MGFRPATDHGFDPSIAKNLMGYDLPNFELAIAPARLASDLISCLGSTMTLTAWFNYTTDKVAGVISSLGISFRKIDSAAGNSSPARIRQRALDK